MICKIMLRKSAKILNLSLYTKDNIDIFIEKFVLVINKSIEIFTLFQKFMI